MKKELIAQWEKHCRATISDTKEIELDGFFRAYVDAFDFSIFGYKTSLQVIEEHQGCPYHAMRFGGGLPARPVPEAPPEEIASTESRYVEQLLGAYADHKKSSVPDVNALEKHGQAQRAF